MYPARTSLLTAFSYFLKFLVTARISRINWKWEITFVTTLTLGVFWFYRHLFFREVTFYHDTVLWYGIFHYFSESLWMGEWPFWNPYVHGGEPFYYAWNVIRAADPVTLFSILISSVFKPDLFDLYNFNLILRVISACLGTYLVVRLFLVRIFSLVFVSFLIFWTTLGGSNLSILANLDSFCWFPWILWGLINVLRIRGSGTETKRRRGRWILMTSWFAGIMVGGAVYQWVYTFFVLFYFILGLIFLKKISLVKIFRSNWRALLLGTLLIGCMSAPLLALYFEKENIFPSVRVLERQYAQSDPLTDTVSKSFLGVNYDHIAGRSHRVGLEQLIETLPSLYPSYDLRVSFGQISGVFFLIGLLFSRHRFRWPLTLSFLATFFLCIGPQPGIEWLHKFLYLSVPPMLLTRDLSLIYPFFVFFTIVFTGLGLDRLIGFAQKTHAHEKKRKLVFYVAEKFERVINKSPQVFVILSAVFVFLFLSITVFPSNIGAGLVGRDYQAGEKILLLATSALIAYFIAKASVLLFINEKRVNVQLVTSSILITLLAASMLENVLIVNKVHSLPKEKGFKYWNYEDYFRGFSFPGKAIEVLPAPTIRTLGLDWARSYFVHGPAISKTNVALDDIMLKLDPPEGSGKRMNEHFVRMRFPIGMYHVWLKDYLRLYEIGEWNPLVFTKLMRVNEPLVQFRTNYVVSDGFEADRLLKRTQAYIIRPMLDKAAILSGSSNPGWPGYSLKKLISEVSAQDKPDIKTTPLEQTPITFFNNSDHEDWTYQHPQAQDEPEHFTTEDVSQFSSAIRIPKPLGGRVVLRYLNYNLDNYIGKTIFFDIWIRSHNTSPKAIGADLQIDRTHGPIDISSYGNSGNWEKVRLRSLIKRNDEFLAFTLVVEPTVTGPVEIANLSMGVLPTSILNEAKINFPNPPDHQFKSKVISFSPSKLVLEIDCTRRGILTYTDIWSNDWKVTVNGEAAPLLKTDISFKGVALEPGHHRVAFTFNPLFFKVTFSMYIAGILIGIMGILAVWMPSRKYSAV